MKRVENKVVIVTGAASGMGAAEVNLLAKEGAKIVATDIQEKKLNELVSRINQNGGKAIAVKHDVTNEEEWDEVVRKATDEFGIIDVLVNNAGIGGEEGYFTLDQIDLKSWNKFLNVNATGNFLGIKKVVPEMKKAGGGSIICTSSIAGLVGGAAGIQYTASKGANRLLAKASAMELAPHNIRVNSIHPGLIDTPMVSIVTEDKNTLEETLKSVPLGRAGKPEDVANLILFLASDESQYITGTEIPIDGGYTAR